jgi:hypothetical protein
MRCVLEVRANYPWFREGYPFMGHVRALLSMAAIAAERPEFEKVYDIMYRTLLKIMRLEKNATAETALAVWEAFRRTWAGRYLIPRLHGIARGIANAPLDKSSATNQVILKNLEYVMADTERLLRA